MRCDAERASSACIKNSYCQRGSAEIAFESERVMNLLSAKKLQFLVPIHYHSPVEDVDMHL